MKYTCISGQELWLCCWCRSLEELSVSRNSLTGKNLFDGLLDKFIHVWCFFWLYQGELEGERNCFWNLKYWTFRNERSFSVIERIKHHARFSLLQILFGLYKVTLRAEMMLAGATMSSWPQALDSMPKPSTKRFRDLRPVNFWNRSLFIQHF